MTEAPKPTRPPRGRDPVQPPPAGPRATIAPIAATVIALALTSLASAAPDDDGGDPDGSLGAVRAAVAEAAERDGLRAALAILERRYERAIAAADDEVGARSIRFEAALTAAAMLEDVEEAAELARAQLMAILRDADAPRLDRDRAALRLAIVERRTGRRRDAIRRLASLAGMVSATTSPSPSPVQAAAARELSDLLLELEERVPGLDTATSLQPRIAARAAGAPPEARVGAGADLDERVRLLRTITPSGIAVLRPEELLAAPRGAEEAWASFVAASFPYAEEWGVGTVELAPIAVDGDALAPALVSRLTGTIFDDTDTLGDGRRIATSGDSIRLDRSASPGDEDHPARALAALAALAKDGRPRHFLGRAATGGRLIERIIRVGGPTAVALLDGSALELILVGQGASLAGAVVEVHADAGEDAIVARAVVGPTGRARVELAEILEAEALEAPLDLLPVLLRVTPAGDGEPSLHATEAPGSGLYFGEDEELGDPEDEPRLLEADVALDRVAVHPGERLRITGSVRILDRRDGKTVPLRARRIIVRAYDGDQCSEFEVAADTDADGVFAADLVAPIEGCGGQLAVGIALGDDDEIDFPDDDDDLQPLEWTGWPSTWLVWSHEQVADLDGVAFAIDPPSTPLVPGRPARLRVRAIGPDVRAHLGAGGFFEGTVHLGIVPPGVSAGVGSVDDGGSWHWPDWIPATLVAQAPVRMNRAAEVEVVLPVPALVERFPLPALGFVRVTFDDEGYSVNALVQIVHRAGAVRLDPDPVVVRGGSVPVRVTAGGSGAAETPQLRVGLVPVGAPATAEALRDAVLVSPRAGVESRIELPSPATAGVYRVVARPVSPAASPPGSGEAGGGGGGGDALVGSPVVVLPGVGEASGALETLAFATPRLVVADRIDPGSGRVRAAVLDADGGRVAFVLVDGGHAPIDVAVAPIQGGAASVELDATRARVGSRLGVCAYLVEGGRTSELRAPVSRRRELPPYGGAAPPAELLEALGPVHRDSADVVPIEREQAPPLRLEVAGLDDAVAPGAPIELDVSVAGPDGRPARALVTATAFPADQAGVAAALIATLRASSPAPVRVVVDDDDPPSWSEAAAFEFAGTDFDEDEPAAPLMPALRNVLRGAMARASTPVGMRSGRTDAAGRAHLSLPTPAAPGRLVVIVRAIPLGPALAPRNADGSRAVEASAVRSTSAAARVATVELTRSRGALIDFPGVVGPGDEIVGRIRIGAEASAPRIEVAGATLLGPAGEDVVIAPGVSTPAVVTIPGDGADAPRILVRSGETILASWEPTLRSRRPANSRSLPELVLVPAGESRPLPAGGAARGQGGVRELVEALLARAYLIAEPITARGRADRLIAGETLLRLGRRLPADGERMPRGFDDLLDVDGILTWAVDSSQGDAEMAAYVLHRIADHPDEMISSSAEDFTIDLISEAIANETLSPRGIARTVAAVRSSADLGHVVEDYPEPTAFDGLVERALRALGAIAELRYTIEEAALYDEDDDFGFGFGGDGGWEPPGAEGEGEDDEEGDDEDDEDGDDEDEDEDEVDPALVELVETVTAIARDALAADPGIVGPDAISLALRALGELRGLRVDPDPALIARLTDRVLALAGQARSSSVLVELALGLVSGLGLADGPRTDGAPAVAPVATIERDGDGRTARVVSVAPPEDPIARRLAGVVVRIDPADGDPASDDEEDGDGAPAPGASGLDDPEAIIEVDRKYERTVRRGLTERTEALRPGDAVRRGETISVILTLRARSPLRHILIRDPWPAGARVAAVPRQIGRGARADEASGATVFALERLGAVTMIRYDLVMERLGRFEAPPPELRGETSLGAPLGSPFVFRVVEPEPGEEDGGPPLSKVIAVLDNPLLGYLKIRALRLLAERGDPRAAAYARAIIDEGREESGRALYRAAWDVLLPAEGTSVETAPLLSSGDVDESTAWLLRRLPSLVEDEGGHQVPPELRARLRTILAATAARRLDVLIEMVEGATDEAVRETTSSFLVTAFDPDDGDLRLVQRITGRSLALAFAAVRTSEGAAIARDLIMMLLDVLTETAGSEGTPLDGGGGPLLSDVGRPPFDHVTFEEVRARRASRRAAALLVEMLETMAGASFATDHGRRAARRPIVLLASLVGDADLAATVERVAALTAVGDREALGLARASLGDARVRSVLEPELERAHARGDAMTVSVIASALSRCTPPEETVELYERLSPAIQAELVAGGGAAVAPREVRLRMALRAIENDEHVEVAAIALAQVRPRDAKLLERLARSEAAIVRRVVAELLPPEPRFLETLALLARDDSDSVAHVALRALVRAGDLRAARRLLAETGSGSSDVPMIASDPLLASLAAPELIAAAKAMGERNRGYLVGFSGVLAATASESDAALLSGSLEVEYNVYTLAALLRHAGTGRLGREAFSAAIGSVREGSPSDLAVVQAAARGRAPDPALLGDATTSVRLAAALRHPEAGLVEIEAAANDLEYALEVGVAELAAEALVRMGTPEALAALVERPGVEDPTGDLSPGTAGGRALLRPASPEAERARVDAVAASVAPILEENTDAPRAAEAIRILFGFARRGGEPGDAAKATLERLAGLEDGWNDIRGLAERALARLDDELEPTEAAHWTDRLVRGRAAEVVAAAEGGNAVAARVLARWTGERP